MCLVKSKNVAKGAAEKFEHFLSNGGEKQKGLAVESFQRAENYILNILWLTSLFKSGTGLGFIIVVFYFQQAAIQENWNNFQLFLSIFQLSVHIAMGVNVGFISGSKFHPIFFNYGGMFKTAQFIHSVGLHSEIFMLFVCVTQPDTDIIFIATKSLCIAFTFYDLIVYILFCFLEAFHFMRMDLADQENEKEESLEV